MSETLEETDKRYQEFFHTLYHKRIIKMLNHKKNKEFYYDRYKEIPFDDEEATCKLIEEAFYTLDNNLSYILMHRYMYNHTIKETSETVKLSEARIVDLTRQVTYRLLDKMKNIQLYGDNLIAPEELDTRTYNIIKRAGYKCNSDLKDIDYITFSKYRNAGKLSWKVLCEYMDKHNIQYDKTDPDISIFSEKLSNMVDKFISKKCPTQQQLEDIQSHVNGILSIVTEMSDL